MGFSIGGLLSGAGAAAAAQITGPLGPVIRGGLAGGFATVPRPGTSTVPVPQQAARFPMRLPGSGGVLFGTGVTIADILRRARENSGRSVSSRTIRDSVRVCGIEVTTETFGLTASEVCQVAIATGRRRSRGISAADLRRTRSTIRKVSTIRKQLTALSTGRKC